MELKGDGKWPDVNTWWWTLSWLSGLCPCPLTMFHTGSHLIPNSKLQRSQMLCGVDEDVSYALWLLNIALGPETQRQFVLLSKHLKHPLVVSSHEGIPPNLPDVPKILCECNFKELFCCLFSASGCLATVQSQTVIADGNIGARLKGSDALLHSGSLTWPASEILAYLFFVCL